MLVPDLTFAWQLALLAAVSAAAGSIAYTAVLSVLKKIARNNAVLNAAIAEGSVQPLRLLIPLLLASLFLPYAPDSVRQEYHRSLYGHFVDHLLRVAGDTGARGA